jgi:hypothetical protein
MRLVRLSSGQDFHLPEREVRSVRVLPPVPGWSRTVGTCTVCVVTLVLTASVMGTAAECARRSIHSIER